MKPGHTPLPLLLAALCVLGGGCQTTEPTDMFGTPIPRGEFLDGTRIDRPELLAGARRVVVLPIDHRPVLGRGLPDRILSSAAAMATREIAEGLEREGAHTLESVSVASEDPEADLYVQGRISAYVPPDAATDFLAGGKERVEITGEIIAHPSGELVGAWSHTEPYSGRDWWEDEENTFKHLCRLIGRRVGMAIAAEITRR